jgi:hypothetical protein
LSKTSIFLVDVAPRIQCGPRIEVKSEKLKNISDSDPTVYTCCDVVPEAKQTSPGHSPKNLAGALKRVVLRT